MVEQRALGASDSASREEPPGLPTPVYSEAGITIYHGDCRVILPSFPSESVDVCCTDAPYGVGFRGRFDRKHAPIVGDEELSWVEPVYREVFRVLKQDTLSVFFYGWPHAETFLSAWKRLGFRPVSHLCFVKNYPGLGRFTRNQARNSLPACQGPPSASAKSDCGHDRLAARG